MGNKCPGVPGVRLPGDIVDDQPSAKDDESLLSSFPISELSLVLICSVCTTFSHPNAPLMLTDFPN